MCIYNNNGVFAKVFVLDTFTPDFSGFLSICQKLRDLVLSYRFYSVLIIPLSICMHYFIDYGICEKIKYRVALSPGCQNPSTRKTRVPKKP